MITGAAMTTAGIALVAPMDYPGKVVSVNHCYRQDGGRKYLHTRAKRWRDDLAEALGWALVAAGLRGVPLEPRATVRIDAAYVDEGNATDPNNIAKLAFDAAQTATGINDRHMQPATGTVVYGAAIPSITVTVTVWRQASGEDR